MAGGAPVGNQNAKKARECAEALRWALEHYESGTIAQGRALRAIASKLVDKATKGDLQAITEIFNRLDGKPTQPVEQSGESQVTVVFKDAIASRPVDYTREQKHGETAAH